MNSFDTDKIVNEVDRIESISDKPSDKVNNVVCVRKETKI